MYLCNAIYHIFVLYFVDSTTFRERADVQKYFHWLFGFHSIGIIAPFWPPIIESPWVGPSVELLKPDHLYYI